MEDIFQGSAKPETLSVFQRIAKNNVTPVVRGESIFNTSAENTGRSFSKSQQAVTPFEAELQKQKTKPLPPVSLFTKKSPDRRIAFTITNSIEKPADNICSELRRLAIDHRLTYSGSNNYLTTV